MIRSCFLAVLVGAVALVGTSCENTTDPTWGPQCPPGYVDSCDSSGCVCKKE